jgi:hypothetical protein
MALTVAAAVLLTACARTSTGTAATGASPADTTSPGAGTTSPVSPAPTKGCTPDYCVPASWETAQAPTPLPQIPPFSEPLNVVLSARSTVSLTALQQALGNWKTVHANTQISVAGIHLTCISPEKADVTGGGYIAQQVAWRLDGCVHGNELSISGSEGHVRMWHQPVPRSANGAWFIAASYETMCLVRNGTLRTVAANKAYAVLHPSSAYHCVDGGPATIKSSYPDGYDDGAKAFTTAVTTAARTRGWHVSQQVITAPRSAHAGEGGVPFSADVYVLTVTSR